MKSFVTVCFALAAFFCALGTVAACGSFEKFSVQNGNPPGVSGWEWGEKNMPISIRWLVIQGNDYATGSWDFSVWNAWRDRRIQAEHDIYWREWQRPPKRRLPPMEKPLLLWGSPGHVRR